MNLRLLGAAFLLLAAATVGAADPTSAEPGSCGDLPEYHLLDFWLGAWDVYVGGTLAGTNRVTRILDGCALEEDWHSATGGLGRSIFWYDRAAGAWKQLWVTSGAFRPGGTKEKVLTEVLPDGSLRFQGTVTRPDGTSCLDRTTLAPLPGGEVRQLIEVSDDGAAWRAVFDAVYRPAG